MPAAYRPVADKRFPRGGGANPWGGAPTYYSATFSQKLHEIERIWTPKGRASLVHPLHLPLQTDPGPEDQCSV